MNNDNNNNNDDNDSVPLITDPIFRKMYRDINKVTKELEKETKDEGYMNAYDEDRKEKGFKEMLEGWGGLS